MRLTTSGTGETVSHSKTIESADANPSVDPYGASS
jgi:hypothetical protein